MENYLRALDYKQRWLKFRDLLWRVGGERIRRLVAMYWALFRDACAAI